MRRRQTSRRIRQPHADRLRVRDKVTWVAVGGILAILLLAIWMIATANGSNQTDRRIAILSSIPLRWGEGGVDDIVNGKAQPDPLVARLQQFGKIAFVDSVSEIQAAKPDVAILIQPRPLSPDEFVRLDKWVRAGGRLLIFADPALQWPSELPIGDPQRPLFTSMLSPILSYWGLELVMPTDAVEATENTDIGEFSVEMASVGNWQRAGGDANASGNCRIDRNRIMAECRPGKGQVILVADADLLHHQNWQSAMGSGERNDNIIWVGDLLDALTDGARIVS